MIRSRAGAARLLVCLALGCARGGTGPAQSPTAKLATVVGTGEVHGTTEPCGCNSDPLGDLARVVALSRGGLLVDAGNLLYDAGPIPESRRAQADRKARAIAAIYTAADAEVNLPDESKGPDVREVAGIRIGVFRVAKAGPDAAAGIRQALAKLAADHAEVMLGLYAMPRAETRALLKQVPGVDFAIVGAEVGEGMAEPEPVGDAWLMAPADQGRRVVRLDLSRGTSPPGTRLHLARFDGEAGRARAIERLDRRKAALEEQLARFAADKSADPSFVAARRSELEQVKAERAQLQGSKIAPPSTPYFTYALEPVRQRLPRDPDVAARLQALARDNGRANLAAAQNEPPPPPEKGRPSYVGGAACARCHKAAAEFWAKTRHAVAWKTLVDVDKQYDYDCINCHTTGWQAPGGANLGSVEKKGLVNVQCEVCHGPGSTHVEESGLDDPRTITKGPAPDLCATRCHTKEHSDTFAFEPYLRDIVGPGHGEARRKALGDGPTGHELRKKALEAARQ